VKSICFFNNKGGVGKTTLTCNMAFTFAKDFHKKVLVVDCDPQCNATILMLGEERSMPLYWNDIDPSNPLESSTLIEALRPLEFGDSSICTSLSVVDNGDNRFCVDLLPGHPRVSIIEERLAQAWRDASGGEIEGLRRTNWAKLLCDHFSADYDLIIFDLGPSLGSLNRSCLIGTDYFVTPMGADIFSMIGLRNISEWLEQWIDSYTQSLAACDKKYSGAIDHFGLRRNLPIQHGFAGYTVQAYIAKYTSGERRPTRAFERIISSFPSEIENNLAKYRREGVTSCLSEIPNMYSLVPLAQAVSAPIGGLNTADGLVGTHFSQAKKYQHILHGTASRILHNIDLGG
jgi:cellulose biosynthesis protein BcsQ